MRKVWGAICVLLLSSPLAWGQPAAGGSGMLQERLKAVMADPAALQAAVAAGRKASFFCANCHGEDGNSKLPDVPNLAGQNPFYLVEQIRKFGAAERKNEFMQGVIKVLKDDERLQIALFYAQSKALPGRADPVQAARGKEAFARLCARCHGEQARGSDIAPRLAAQKPAYLQASVIRFRDRTGERVNPLMATATANLKNEDIAAIAAYLTQLP